MWVGLAIVMPTIFNYFPESPAFLMVPLPQWLFRLLYFPWIPLMIFPETSWLMEFLFLPEIWTNAKLWLLIELIRPIITVLGFGLFLLSFTQMFLAMRKGRVLVTSFFYSLVRHPQYLGIILWTFGHVLYSLPVHLRPADFLGWLTLLSMYLLLAHLEEKWMEREVKGYLDYRSKVPFMIPFVKSGLFRWSRGILPKGLWKRLLIFLCIYLLIMGLSAYSFWGRTYCDWNKYVP